VEPWAKSQGIGQAPGANLGTPITPGFLLPTDPVWQKAPRPCVRQQTPGGMGRVAPALPTMGTDHLPVTWSHSRPCSCLALPSAPEVDVLKGQSAGKHQVCQRPPRHRAPEAGPGPLVPPAGFLQPCKRSLWHAWAANLDPQPAFLSLTPSAEEEEH
jgi:hypothetical protein